MTAANLTSGELDGVQFTARSGGIIGVAGPVGSGYADVNQMLFGLTEEASGEITVERRRAELVGHEPADAVKMGVGMVPVERDKVGVA